MWTIGRAVPLRQLIDIIPNMSIGVRSINKYEIKVNAADDCIEIPNIMMLPFSLKTDESDPVKDS